MLSLATCNYCVAGEGEIITRHLRQREVKEMKTPEICKKLGISATNMGVLFRACNRLRECVGRKGLKMRLTMPSCSQVTRLIASDEYLSVGPFRKLAIRLHLMMCKYCSRYRDQLRALAARLRAVKYEVPPSEATSNRIVDRICQKP